MELKELIERLKDMELLYGNAVIHVKSDQNEYRIKSVDGFIVEKRPNECRDPHVVVINVKNIKTIHQKKKAGKWERHNTYHGDDTSGFIDPDWRCSECGRQANVNEWFMYDLTDFCPNCGADMRGEQDEKETD